jgi:pilus assembly protein Flp/PilA
MSKLNDWIVSKTAVWKAREEEGQGLAEYGLILALVAVACILALGVLGTNISTALDNVGTSL